MSETTPRPTLTKEAMGMPPRGPPFTSASPPASADSWPQEFALALESSAGVSRLPA
jgi:hypothetical protein